MEKQIIVTEHAEERIRKRYGVKKKAVQRLAEKAYNNGIHHSDLGKKGGTFDKFVSSKTNNYKRKGNHPVLFGEYLWLFVIHEMEIRLVTVFELPNNLKGKVKEFLKKS